MELIANIPEPIPHSTAQDIRKYPKEKVLFIMLATVSVALLILATVLSVGFFWLMLLWGFMIYLTLASYFICYIRGNAVKVGEDQFPELYRHFKDCCAITGVQKLPSLYLLAGNGALNAYAARFLNRYYVVLLSDVVDALEEDEAAIKMIIGHELGHIQQGHLGMWWVRFAEWIPLLGPAYSRAREYTCDQYGLACCPDVKTAVHAMSVLAAGTKRWKTLNKASYMAQCRDTGGFWMSINELTSDYPWLCKRIARLYHGDEVKYPRRHAMAWFLAALVPGTGLGLFGAAILYSYLLVVGLTIGMAAGGLSMLGKFKELTDPNVASKNMATAAYYEATVAASKVDTLLS